MILNWFMFPFDCILVLADVISKFALRLRQRHEQLPTWSRL